MKQCHSLYVQAKENYLGEINKMYVQTKIQNSVGIHFNQD